MKKTSLDFVPRLRLEEELFGTGPKGQTVLINYVYFFTSAMQTIKSVLISFKEQISIAMGAARKIYDVYPNSVSVLYLWIEQSHKWNFHWAQNYGQFKKDNNCKKAKNMSVCRVVISKQDLRKSRINERKNMLQCLVNISVLKNKTFFWLR